MKKQIIISLLSLLLFGLLISSCTEKPQMIRIGLIADIQYCDCDTRGSRFYRNSLPKLEAAVDDINRENVDFTVNLGDLVDRDTENNLRAILSRLGNLEKMVYNTTGNHDYDGVVDNDALYKELGMPSAYYSFKKGSWRFIMLNTNEVASYANVAGTELESELTEMQERIRKTGRKNGASYNGGISRQQMNWLKQELETAQKKKEYVIVFSHHPLYAASGLTALNDLEILEVLASFSCVKAGISGHHHPGDFGTYKEIPFITTEGMIETENENAYGVLELTADQILLKGKGRTKSYDLPIKQ
ncbi:metallophosphoesterase [Massilibacteroides sp.]|uniref:metallophosphoesterase n=1 Tax=Massilibacteroides sp. TaxID=2034766 RepID=UPI0026171CFF|nr:metallophosphoesterase [Massilibacteroides sp.]MDD4514019.1 metallophosphoesterase [Massilibacteroides sp.]